MLDEKQITDNANANIAKAEEAKAKVGKANALSMAITYYKTAWSYLEKSEAESLKPLKVKCLQDLKACIQEQDWDDAKKIKKFSKYEPVLTTLLQEFMSPAAVKAQSDAQVLINDAKNQSIPKAAFSLYKWRHVKSIVSTVKKKFIEQVFSSKIILYELTSKVT